jgi:hypothetical protein
MEDLRKELLSEAKRKLDNNQTRWEQYYHLPIEDFILILYSRCSPSVYGKQFEKKLLYDLKRIGLNICDIPANKNMGDYELFYPPKKYYDEDLKKYRPSINTTKNKEVIVGSDNYKRKRIEVKFSYLGKNDHYTIRNIRPWQDFDYFLFAFVDVHNDFKIMCSLVSKEDFLRSDNTFSAMNGTSESNRENKNISLGCVIKENSFMLKEIMGDIPSSLEEYNLNLLDGSTLDDLKKFLSEDTLRMKDDFINGINELEINGEKLNLDIDEVFKLNRDRDISLYEIIDYVNKNSSTVEVDPEMEEYKRRLYLTEKLNNNIRLIRKEESFG